MIAIAISSFFINQSSAQASIIEQFRATFGQGGADLIESLIRANVSEQANIVVGIIGFSILLLGATGVFSQLQAALDTIFESLPEKPLNGWWAVITQKLLSLGMVLSVGFLLLASLVLSAVIKVISSGLADSLPEVGVLAHILELAISFILISLFLGLMYRVLPSKRLRWKPALVGGLIAGVLFTISKYLLGLYLGSAEPFSSYGAASALVLVIIWTYYMSQVFFLSAILLRLYVVPKLR